MIYLQLHKPTCGRDLLEERDDEIPDPTEFGISPTLGFLSPHPPSLEFKDSYYKPWDALTQKLAESITSAVLEEEIAQVPLLHTDKLNDALEYRRAYVVLAFLAHAYVWSKATPNECVPPQIAEPFLDVCAYLRMEPVLSYAGLCSWNWRAREGGSMDLEELDTLASFTGTRGEAAFYHVPVLVEYEGGYLVHQLLDAIKAAANEQSATVLAALEQTTQSLVRMSEQLPKMYSVLEAKFFYHKLRPFLAGGKGMEEKGLPRGMVFLRTDGSETPCKLVGGSAAQSSLFQFLDHVLGVVHHDYSFFKVRVLDKMHGNTRLGQS